MNAGNTESGGIIVGIVGCLACLLLAVYFAFMGFFNYVGRNPNPGMGSFGVIMCGVSLWGAFKAVRWGLRTRKQPVNNQRFKQRTER